MYIRNKTNIENLRVKANNSYIVLDEFSLESVRESVLNRYVCSSILRNIVTNEINNFDNLIDYLKSVLLYQVKVIEKEQEKFNYEEEYQRINKEIAELEEQSALLISQGMDNTQIETILFNKRQEASHYQSEINLLTTIIENMKTSFTSYRIPEISTTIPLSSAYFETIEVDLNHLDSNRNYIKFVYDKFNSDAKEPYVNSDITEYFDGYAFKTDKVYDMVLDCLNRIYNAIDTYMNDSTYLERSLSKMAKPGIISNAELVALLQKMPDLSDYNNKINNIIETANTILADEHDKSENMVAKVSSDSDEDLPKFKEKDITKKNKKEKQEDNVVTKTLKDMGIKPSLINEKLVGIKFNKKNIKKLQPGDILKKKDKLSMITDISNDKVKIVKDNNEMIEISVNELYSHNYDQIFIMDNYDEIDIETGDKNAN
jgi:hypothetical protein